MGRGTPPAAARRKPGQHPLRWAWLAIAFGSFSCKERGAPPSTPVAVTPRQEAAPQPAAGSTAEERAEPVRREASTRVRRAAEAAAAGNLTRARIEIAGIPVDAPEFPQALFVRSCIALEEEDWDGAAHDIAQLRTALPQRAEPRLLAALLTHRSTPPELGWREAFLRAWNEVGRPDFQASHLFSEDLEPAWEGPSVEEAWRQTSEPLTRVVLALAEPQATEERARALLQQLPALDSPELVVAAFGYLHQEGLPADVRARASAVLRARLAELSTASPDTLQLRLLLLLGGTSAHAPLTPQELQALEGLTTLSEWRESEHAPLYQEVRRHLESAGVPDAARRALTLAVQSLTGPAPSLLLERARATQARLTDPERHRLGSILWRIGARLAAESTVLERILGLSLMQQGAADMRDDERSDQVAALLQEARVSIEVSRRVALGRWPLRSLLESMLEASTRDELEHLRGFLAKAPAATTVP